jgi:8-oxo-dGTP pyrophosphatase MutT (NUDIX family)
MAENSYDLVRQVRDFDGNIWMDSILLPNLQGHPNDNTLLVSLTKGGIVWLVSYSEDGKCLNNVMEGPPTWYRLPTNLSELVEKYQANGKQPLPVKPNVVTFTTFMADGRGQYQRRGFKTPKGADVANAGMDSINGGGIKPGETLEQALQREGREELGVDVLGAHTYIGAVYDAEEGRFNLVYRIDGYDRVMVSQLTVEQAVHALTNPEGIGRGFMYLEDLEAVIEKGLLTPISVAILKAFPQLLPPARPQ